MSTRSAMAAIALCISASFGTAAEDGGTVFMWKAQKDGAAVYLLGSIHALRKDAYPLPEVIEAAFDQSEVVVFEIDLDDMVAVATKMLEAGSLEDGLTLEEVAGPVVWSEFSMKMNAAGMPSGMFQFMKPWMAAMTVAAFELENAGYTSESGIDTHFWNRAKTTNKETEALETADFQVGLFASLTPEESLAFLEYTLSDLETMIPQLDEMTRMWSVGDAQAIKDVREDEFADYPDLYEKLIGARNRAWLPAIEQLLGGDRDAMVVVGAMHLVAEDGIIEMLRQRGYTVTQL